MSCSSVHGDHNRYLYARTESDQTRWLDALRQASRTEPFEDKYTLGVGRGVLPSMARQQTRSSLWMHIRSVLRRCLWFVMLQRELGSGRFSKVFEAVSVDTGEEFAVKMINKADLKEASSGIQCPEGLV